MKGFLVPNETKCLRHRRRNTRGRVQAARLRADKLGSHGGTTQGAAPRRPTVPPGANPQPPHQQPVRRGAHADAATATPPATPPACAASSAALEAWGELASEGGTSCQNFCSALDQSARMALPLAEPAGRGRQGWVVVP